MNRQTFMTIAAGVSAISGVAGLLAPAQLAAVFGATFDDVAVSQARLLGASYLGYATIAWLGKDVRDSAAHRAIAIGSLVSWALSLIVIVLGIVTGLAGTQAWLLVALAAVFATAWWYVAFIERTVILRE